MRRSASAARYAILRRLLIEARQQAGLTQREVAAALNQHQSWVAKLETGERTLDVIEFIQLCEAIGVSPSHALARLQKALLGAQRP